MFPTLSTVALLASLAVSGPAPDAPAFTPDAFLSSCINRIVQAHDTRSYSVDISAGNAMVISLAGDGDTDLDLFVYDSAGRLIASDIGLTDQARVSFSSARTQTLTVEVRNLGGIWNRFWLCID